MTAKNEPLPEGWREVKLKEVANLRNGKYQPSDSLPVRCIELEHLEKNSGRIIGEIDAGTQNSTKNIFKAGDVLFGKLRPYLRKFGLPKFNGVCSSEIWAFVSNTDLITNKYLFYSLQTGCFINSACKTTGTKMPRADWNFVQNVPVALPPLSEQKAIASLLEKWDTAIEKTEALIEAKEKRFKWLLKILISDQQDNPEWRQVKLADACEVIVSPVDKKTVDEELPVKLCNYTDVYYNNAIDSKINFMAATAKPREIEKFSIITDDVIITKDSETPDDIGVPAYVKETIDDLLCGYHLTILRPRKQTIGKYMCYALISPRVKYDFYRFANGITRFGLTKESYQKIKIALPLLTEQKRIANILDTAEKEVEFLNQLAEQYRTQKRGLMQKLLTGKWRVKPNTKAEV